MNCPICTNVSLVMSDRQGIEIDYCPQCRGVWLDRGELDKIIDRSQVAHQARDTITKDASIRTITNPPSTIVTGLTKVTTRRRNAKGFCQTCSTLTNS